MCGACQAFSGLVAGVGLVVNVARWPQHQLPVAMRQQRVNRHAVHDSVGWHLRRASHSKDGCARSQQEVSGAAGVKLPSLITRCIPRGSVVSSRKACPARIVHVHSRSGDCTQSGGGLEIELLCRGVGWRAPPVSWAGGRRDLGGDVKPLRDVDGVVANTPGCLHPPTMVMVANLP